MFEYSAMNILPTFYWKHFLNTSPLPRSNITFFIYLQIFHPKYSRRNSFEWLWWRIEAEKHLSCTIHGGIATISHWVLIKFYFAPFTIFPLILWGFTVPCVIKRKSCLRKYNEQNNYFRSGKKVLLTLDPFSFSPRGKSHWCWIFRGKGSGILPRVFTRCNSVSFSVNCKLLQKKKQGSGKWNINGTLRFSTFPTEKNMWRIQVGEGI